MRRSGPIKRFFGLGFASLCDVADEACPIGRIEHRRGLAFAHLSADDRPRRRRCLQRRVHRRQHGTGAKRITPQKTGRILPAAQHVARQRNTRVAQRYLLGKLCHRIGHQRIDRRVLIGHAIDEGRIGAVLQQAADEIGEQILVTADRRVNAHARAVRTASLPIVLVKLLAHAMQALEFEIAPSAGEGFHGGQRMGVVGREHAVDRIRRSEYRPRACDIRRVARRLTGEDRILDESRFLRPLDLGIPIGALHQPHGDAHAMMACQIDQPPNRGQAALLIGLNRKAKPVPALQLGVFEQRLEDVEHQLVPIGLFGVDGQPDIDAPRPPREIGKRRQ